MEEHTRCIEDIKVAIVDVETTGLDALQDRILQIAMLFLDYKGRPLKLYGSYFNPGIDLSNYIYSKSHQIHKIPASVIANAPSFGEKANEILELLGKVDIIAGHNIVFDFDFMRSEFNYFGKQLLKEQGGSNETGHATQHSKTGDFKSEILEKFDSMKFKLIDTYRLSLVAFPNKRSYSLSSLADHIGMVVNECQVVSYKWGTPCDECELKSQETVKVMKQHNALTDVLETEILLRNCMKILKITYMDIINGKCQRYELNKAMTLGSFKLLNEKMIPKKDLIDLVKLAPDQLNVNFPNRAANLIEMKAEDLKEVVKYLSKRTSIADRRQKIICQGFIAVISDKEELKKLSDQIHQQRQQNLKGPWDGKSILENDTNVKELIHRDKTEQQMQVLKESRKREAEINEKLSADGYKDEENAKKKQKWSHENDKEDRNESKGDCQILIADSYEDETEENDMNSCRGSSSGRFDLMEDSESTLTQDSAIDVQGSQDFENALSATDSEAFDESTKMKKRERIKTIYMVSSLD